MLKKEYRPELNGLRGLAVLMVLVYHLDVSWAKGGFLGVDVFLVISGYFITRNILAENQLGRFTFKRFYTKRIRRLFPALLFTLIVVLIAGFFIFPPSAYERLGNSSFFASISLSNFFFMNEAGYFDLESIAKPLLHMWSLSLEEQFYLFWPLLIFLTYKYLRKYFVIIISLVFLLSLTLAELFYDLSREMTFYMLPFRMFEFVLGAMAIWIERAVGKLGNNSKELLFSIGIILIVFSGIHFDSFTKMPGALSLVPCGAAVLVITGGNNKFTSGVLSNKMMELIGKASYSIYLIHWPLIVFYKHLTNRSLDLSQQLMLGSISIILGILMYLFIENTFRYPKRTYKKWDPVWIVIPLLIIGICSYALKVSTSQGLADRFPDSLFLSKEEIEEQQANYFQNYKTNEQFLLGDPANGHILIMGNSHSVDLIYALRQNGYSGKITSLRSLGKCYNFGRSYDPEDESWCLEQLRKNLDHPNWKKVEAIYLHDNWREYDEKGLREVIRDIRALNDAPVIVFGPKMIFRKDLLEIIGSSRSLSPMQINQHANRYLDKTRHEINSRLLEEFENRSYSDRNISYIDMLKIQKPDSIHFYEVISRRDTSFLYFDSNHFTQQGSLEFGERLRVSHPELFTHPSEN